MPLTVETGAMPEGANAYCGVAFADGYLGDRGHSDWPPGEADLAAKTAALIKAADYLNGLGWHGRKAAAAAPRVMAWPRVGARDSDGGAIPEDSVPLAVQAANAYLARLAFLGTDLQPILEHGGRVQSESVDTLSKSYFDDAPVRAIYAGLADLLRGLADEFEDYAGTGGSVGKPKASILEVTT
jgi:hypothetical protein